MVWKSEQTPFLGKRWGFFMEEKFINIFYLSNIFIRSVSCKRKNLE